MKAGWLSLGLWAAALAAWAWLWRGARARARLLDRISTRRGGFVRTRFSWLTLCPEPREVSFVLMIGAAPCRCRVGFLLPPRGGPVPATVVELDLPEARFGPDPGRFGPGDLAGGRGLFLAGTDVTVAWRRFLADLPPGVPARLTWAGATVQLAMPGLLGDEEEVWVDRALGFLGEAAAEILPARGRPSPR